MKGGYDRKGLFGDIIHYDENGKKIGISKKGLFGNYREYDADGNKIGSSFHGPFGHTTRYDNNGKKVGTDEQALLWGTDHYDNDGNKIGHSDPTLIAGWDDRRERMERAARMGAAMEMANRNNTPSQSSTSRSVANNVPIKDEYMGYKSSVDWYNERKKK